MDTVISLLVLSTLPQLAAPVAPLVTSFRAVVEIVSGDSRIFSGESLRLKCSVPDALHSSWDYLWFRGTEQLPQIGEQLILWNTKVQESGEFYCQGVRDTTVRDIHTLKSLPLEINVDGGWAILEVPAHPSLVGNSLMVTCRVRGSPLVHEVILYKDGVEVMRQNGLNPHLYLTNVTLEDQGMYSCRASWDIGRRTRSVISADVSVRVSEVLTHPVLEIIANNDLIPVNKMKLICHLEYNAPAPAPPIHYYFYKNNNRLGTATSENHDLFSQTPGQYSCRVKVPELGVERSSEPKTFGEVAGPQTMVPPTLHPRDPRPLAPPISSPDLSLLPAAEPTAARPSPQPSTAAPTYIQLTEETIQPSNPLLKPPQPAPSTLLSTDQSLDQTASPSDIYDESGEMSGESGDVPEYDDMFGESGDMPEEYGDMSAELGGAPEQSGNMSGGSGDMPADIVDMFGESGDMPEEFDDLFEGSGDMPEESDDLFEGSGDMPEEFDDLFEGSGDMPEESDDLFEGSGDMPEESDDLFEGSGDMPEESDDLFEGSGDMPEEFDDMFQGSGDMPEEFDDMFEESGDMP